MQMKNLRDAVMSGAAEDLGDDALVMVRYHDSELGWTRIRVDDVVAEVIDGKPAVVFVVKGD